MENQCEYIAYRGYFYIIEWFYDEKENSEVFEYYRNLSGDVRRKILVLFKRMGDLGIIYDKTKFRCEGDQIYSFKPQPHRF